MSSNEQYSNQSVGESAWLAFVSLTQAAVWTYIVLGWLGECPEGDEFCGDIVVFTSLFVFGMSNILFVLFGRLYLIGRTGRHDEGGGGKNVEVREIPFIVGNEEKVIKWLKEEEEGATFE